MNDLLYLSLNFVLVFAICDTPFSEDAFPLYIMWLQRRYLFIGHADHCMQPLVFVDTFTLHANCCLQPIVFIDTLALHAYCCLQPLVFIDTFTLHANCCLQLLVFIDTFTEHADCCLLSLFFIGTLILFLLFIICFDGLLIASCESMAYFYGFLMIF